MSSSVSSTVTSLATPLTFSGVSQYASDLQSILTRAVQLAELPAQLLQNQQYVVQEQETAASSLSTAVSAVTTDMNTIAALGTSKGLTATSTDTSLVTATATNASSAANYTISNITSIASAATESTLNSYSDSTTQTVSSTGSMQLTVGSTNYSITLDSSTNNLTGLESAINASGAPVTATILTTSSGDYLSISANDPGATTLKLTDDPTGAATTMLTATNQGTDSKFDFNGVAVDSPDSTINNLVSGLTFTLLGTTSTDQTVGISVSSSTSGLASALESLTSDYNTLETTVAGQTGSSGGLLVGNSIVSDTRQAMMNLVSYYSSTGSVHSLADLGITVSDSGVMSFDSSTLDGLSSSQVADAFTFLGSTTSGFGALSSQFSQISDPITGTIKAQQTQYTTANTRLTDQITAINATVNIMQASLETRLEKADAAIASLQSQQSILTSSIQSLDYTSYGSSTTTS